MCWFSVGIIHYRVPQISHSDEVIVLEFLFYNKHLEGAGNFVNIFLLT